MGKEKFERQQACELRARLQEKRLFIQALAGPRQVGKTTLVRQVLAELGGAFHYVSADEPTLKAQTWIAQQWEIGRSLVQKNGGAVLVLDEVQKLEEWSSYVKALWDEDTNHQVNLKVVLLGSSFLSLQLGLSESLAGRFELIHTPHWTFSEIHQALGLGLEEAIYYGTYPGADRLIAYPTRWRRYVLDSLVETTLSRDVLLVSRVHKPALLRRLFELGCLYSGQLLSFQKMLGQLQDAGNTTTLAHYLELLSSAGLLVGLQKYAAADHRQRASSPKFQVLNNALMSTQYKLSFIQAIRDRDHWGRLVESAVGAHLVACAAGTQAKIYYWREGNYEVDFVVDTGNSVLAIEVKSGRTPDTLSGTEKFLEQFPGSKPLLVGGTGMRLEDFFRGNVVQDYRKQG